MILYRLIQCFEKKKKPSYLLTDENTVILVSVKSLKRFLRIVISLNNNQFRLFVCYVYILVRIFLRSFIDENHLNLRQVLLTDWMDKPDILSLSNSFDLLLRGFQETPTRSEQSSYNPLVQMFDICN